MISDPILTTMTLLYLASLSGCMFFGVLMLESGSPRFDIAVCLFTVVVIFLSHAYCGSRECTKEFHYGDMKRFTMIPVFLEFGGIPEEAFPAQVEKLRCDSDRQSHAGWENAKMTIEKVAFGLQVTDRRGQRRQTMAVILARPSSAC